MHKTVTKYTEDKNTITQVHMDLIHVYIKYETHTVQTTDNNRLQRIQEIYVKEKRKKEKTYNINGNLVHITL